MQIYDISFVQIEFILILGVFDGNYYLIQNVLFEYFTSDALLYPSNDLFVNLIVNLLSNIYSTDEDEEEILWLFIIKL
jgi:hypothetical protein